MPRTVSKPEFPTRGRPESLVVMATFRHPITQDTVNRLVERMPHVTVAHPNDATPTLNRQVALVAFERLHQAIADYFQFRRPIIALCATGIVVRALAPVLHNKHQETPVVVVAEDGSCVIPLLGGHHGANDLARYIAEMLGISASITTASDVHLGFSLDQPPVNWKIAHRANLSSLMRLLLAGQSLSVAADVPQKFLQEPCFTLAKSHQSADIVVSDYSVDDAQKLIFYPPTLVLGIGCERHCDRHHLENFVEQIFEKQNLAFESIAAIATVNLKADEDAIQHLAQRLGVPVLLFSPDQCEAMTPYVQNPSQTVFDEIGCHSVAEASALATLPKTHLGCHQNTPLLIAKQKSVHATLAVVRRPGHADKLPPLQGKKLGILRIVGVGPGNRDCQTFGLAEALGQSEIVVGYKLYLDLVADQIAHAQKIARPLGAEQERVDIAMQYAHQGKRVALVCSGDPGIYALASLAFERQSQFIERPQFALQVLPGITAMQAAAAKLGAPMGHDFAAISLSDLLTPVEVIRQRLEAAARGDFVVALYNPQSRTRRTLLGEAKWILRAYRHDNTPVAICRNIGREDEKITLTTIARFDTEMVDMLSLVMVGNSMTRNGRSPHSLFTPRGYIQPITSLTDTSP